MTKADKIPGMKFLVGLLMIGGIWHGGSFAHEALTTGKNPAETNIKQSQLYKGQNANVVENMASNASNVVENMASNAPVVKSTVSNIDNAGTGSSWR